VTQIELLFDFQQQEELDAAFEANAFGPTADVIGREDVGPGCEAIVVRVQVEYMGGIDDDRYGLHQDVAVRFVGSTEISDMNDVGAEYGWRLVISDKL
jgi:hypothetical protein